MLAFLIKTNQHFISELEIHLHHMYHGLNHAAENYYPLFFRKTKTTTLLCRKIVMNTICCSFNLFHCG